MQLAQLSTFIVRLLFPVNVKAGGKVWCLTQSNSLYKGVITSYTGRLLKLNHQNEIVP